MEKKIKKIRRKENENKFVVFNSDIWSYLFKPTDNIFFIYTFNCHLVIDSSLLKDVLELFKGMITSEKE